MKIVERRSASGGTIVEYYNDLGERVRVVHRAGNSYSGKIAQQEDKGK